MGGGRRDMGGCGMIWRRRRTGEVQKVEGEGRRVSDHVGDSQGSKMVAYLSWRTAAA